MRFARGFREHAPPPPPHEEIFENVLRLLRFGVYFERILKIKWLFSYRNNDICCIHARGHAPPRENFEKIVHFGAFCIKIVLYK